MVERKQIERVASEIVDLIMKKNERYKDNFATLGMRGLFVGYHRKVMNLKSMVWDYDGPYIPALVSDTREQVSDLAALGLLGMILLDGVQAGAKAGEPQRKSGPGIPTSHPAAAAKLPVLRGGLLSKFTAESGARPQFASTSFKKQPRRRRMAELLWVRHALSGAKVTKTVVDIAKDKPWIEARVSYATMLRALESLRHYQRLRTDDGGEVTGHSTVTFLSREEAARQTPGKNSSSA